MYIYFYDESLMYVLLGAFFGILLLLACVKYWDDNFLQVKVY